MSFRADKMFEGLSQGFELGSKAGSKFAKTQANRNYAKAQEALAKYNSFDPFDTGGALGKDQEGPPTTRDLQGARDAYLEEARERFAKAGALANDMRWKQEANKMWATQLSQGFSKYSTAAARALEMGDDAAAARALEHAYGMAPTGASAKFKVNEDGNLEMRQYSEATGAMTDMRLVTPMDIRMWAQAETDPTAFLKTTTDMAKLNLERTGLGLQEKHLKQQGEQHADNIAVARTNAATNQTNAETQRAATESSTARQNALAPYEAALKLSQVDKNKAEASAVDRTGMTADTHRSFRAAEKSVDDWLSGPDMENLLAVTQQGGSFRNAMLRAAAGVNYDPAGVQDIIAMVKKRLKDHGPDDALAVINQFLEETNPALPME